MSQSNKEDPDLFDLKLLLQTKQTLLCEQIGVGSYATVYRGFNEQLKKDIAIKIIDLAKASDNYRSEFLRNELAITGKLRHKRIIKIYSISQVGKKVMIVMEFASNGTLSDLIQQQGSLNEKLSRVMFREYFNGLHYMHSESIAHRDLKLENILITAQNVPKLADFSFSIEFLKNSPLCTNYCGSVPYFAPELLQKRPYNPFRSDIWALSVCCFIMTNNIFPFKFGDESAMLNAQLRRTWQFRAKTEKEFSTAYKDLVNSMFEPETKSRITAESIAQHSWLKME